MCLNTSLISLYPCYSGNAFLFNFTGFFFITDATVLNIHHGIAEKIQCFEVVSIPDLCQFSMFMKTENPQTMKP